MNLAAHSLHVVERVERRVLGAFLLRDAVTHLPVVRMGRVRAVSAVLVRGGGDLVVTLPENSVQIRQNRSGFYVIWSAPFFDDYISTFINPQPPPETEAGPLRLRLAAVDVGPHYLPREFILELPRSTDRNGADRVFDPVSVDLFRTPAAPWRDGWALLRVRVVEAGTNPPNPLPGVLVRAFRSPRGAINSVMGIGMTEWRRNIRGEALVAVTGVERFRSGEGDEVIVSDLSIVLEAARAIAFTGADDQLPDPTRIRDAIPLDLVAPAPAGLALRRTEEPVNVGAGRERTVELAMP